MPHLNSYHITSRSIFSYCLTSQSAYWNRKRFIHVHGSFSLGWWIQGVPIRSGFYSTWDPKPGYYVDYVQTRGSERNPNGSWLIDELGCWRWINNPLVLPHPFSPIAMQQLPEHRFFYPWLVNSSKQLKWRWIRWENYKQFGIFWPLFIFILFSRTIAADRTREVAGGHHKLFGWDRLASRSWKRRMLMKSMVMLT